MNTIYDEETIHLLASAGLTPELNEMYLAGLRSGKYILMACEFDTISTRIPSCATLHKRYHYYTFIRCGLNIVCCRLCDTIPAIFVYDPQTQRFVKCADREDVEKVEAKKESSV